METSAEAVFNKAAAALELPVFFLFHVLQTVTESRSVLSTLVDCRKGTPMSTTQTPTVDVEAPNGGRIVLTPAAGVESMPQVSRAGLAVIVTLSAIFLLTGFNPVNHTDVWGHLSFGRWIVENGELPTADPFRWDLPSVHFLNVYWLGQVLGYGWYSLLGLEGLVLAHGGLVTLMGAVMILAVRGRGVPTGWAAAAAVAGFVLALPITGTIRPQLFGMPAFALVLWAVARLKFKTHPLIWLPLLFAFWANVHGSFAIGLVVLGCFAFAETWETARTVGLSRRLWSATGPRRAWAALLLATGGSCVNPLGVKLLLAIAGFGGNPNLDGITEWQPMVLGSLSGGLFFATLVVTAILLRWSPRRISVLEILLTLVFGLASLWAIRMLVWWALAWPWVVAPHAAATWLLHRRSHREPAETDPVLGVKRLLYGAIIVFLTLWWSPSTFGLLTGHCRAEESILSSGTPHAMACRIREMGLSGRIFTPMDWADYIIFQTDEAVRPLIFSHVHLTHPSVWRDYKHIYTAGEAWLEVVDKHEIGYLVLDRRRNGKLAGLAVASQRCRVLCEDRQALLLEVHAPAVADGGTNEVGLSEEQVGSVVGSLDQPTTGRSGDHPADDGNLTNSGISLTEKTREQDVPVP